MKTLKNHVLLYDSDCPMCALYSGTFIQTGMLDKTGRMPFDKITASIKDMIDINRSRNEIALVDTRQQKVIYGLDSLLLILGNNYPFIHTIFRFSPLYWFMKKVYAFISYNRKVIAPSKELHPAGACTPDYHARYRWAFVVVSSFVVAWILNAYFSAIPYLKNSPHGFLIEWGIAVGQLLFQGILVFLLRKDRVLHYLGHNMVISLIGALLLLPAIWFSSFLLRSSVLLYVGYFALPVSVMLWQHIRRIKLLELPSSLTLTWIAYRAGIAAAYLLFTY